LIDELGHLCLEGPGAVDVADFERKLNQLIAFYNHSVAGQLTPAGNILVANNLFRIDQLKSLGAVAPLICSNVHSGIQDCQGLPGHYAQATWLKTIDLRLSWPFRVGERVKLEPNASFFNVFNFANFGGGEAAMLRYLGSDLGVFTKAMADSGLWKARTDFADMFGWPDLVQQVTKVYQQLPLSNRNSVMILASNYGEAGALDFYGHGLPPVVSPHLTYYYWAPARMSPSTVIVVGYERGYLATMFGDIQQAGTITNSYGLRNQEYGKAIWICRSPLLALDKAWPRLKSLQ